MQLQAVKIVPILGLIATGFLVGYVLGPFYVKLTVKMEENLLPNSKFRKWYLKMNIPVMRNVYMFNITNPDQVLQGEAPNVAEIGPYVFELWHHKVNIEDNEANDTVTFDNVITWQFNREKTFPLTGRELITTFHIILVGGLLQASRDYPELMDFAIDAVDDILNHPTHPFMKFTVYDFLFDGLLINCSSSKFSVKAVCGALTEISLVEKVDATTLSVALFKTDNGTSRGRYTVYRGKRNRSQLNQIVEFNNSPTLVAFDEDFCNEIHGTDGQLFAPFTKKSTTVTVFVKEVCRSLSYKYERKVKSRKKPALRFVRMPIDDSVPPYQCFCWDTPDTCTAKGTFELSICRNVPGSVSNPHFYNADPELLTKVTGLHPEKEKHESYIDFHKLSGVPLKSSQKFQLNLEVVPMDAHQTLKNLPNVYLPVVRLDMEYAPEIEIWKTISRMRMVFRIIGWLMSLTGLGIGGYVVVSDLGLLRRTKQVSPKEGVKVAFEYTKAEEEPETEKKT